MQASLHWWKKIRFSCAWLEGNVTHTLTLCYALLWLNRRKSIDAESFAAKNKSGSTKQMNAKKKLKQSESVTFGHSEDNEKDDCDDEEGKHKYEAMWQKNWFEIIDKWKTNICIHNGFVHLCTSILCATVRFIHTHGMSLFIDFIVSII